MASLKGFVRHNKLNIAIFLFVILFSCIHFLKPGFIYDHDGAFRPFGLGYKHKTVIPIWVISIILAILCYLTVLVYVNYL
jgi:hypothetical protein